MLVACATVNNNDIHERDPQGNPKPATVKTRAEHKRGWGSTSRGARVGVASTPPR